MNRHVPFLELVSAEASSNPPATNLWQQNGSAVPRRASACRQTIDGGNSPNHFELGQLDLRYFVEKKEKAINKAMQFALLKQKRV